MMQYIQDSAAFHHELLHEGASWTELGHVRGWCRLRSHAVLLAEHQGTPSRAREANCIFCGARVTGADYQHVLAQCPRWRQPRAAVAHHAGLGPIPNRPQALVEAVLCPGEAWAGVARNMAAVIDEAAADYWASRMRWESEGV